MPAQRLVAGGGHANISRLRKYGSRRKLSEQTELRGHRVESAMNPIPSFATLARIWIHCLSPQAQRGVVSRNVVASAPGSSSSRFSEAEQVLVAGVSGVTAETCKYIVLMGIGRLTLLDDRPVTVEPAGAKFLIEPEEVGQASRTLAKVCAESLREYNPMVKVEVETGNVVDKPAEDFDGFETVVLDGASRSVKKHVNSVSRSREQSVVFYAVDCRDSFGSLFVDLQSCSYTSKKSVAVGVTPDIKTYPALRIAALVSIVMILASENPTSL